ncbi:MAG: hypothetical protein ACJAUC_001476 [Planctomycetota bacterium]|jgi:hypothetical protein
MRTLPILTALLSLLLAACGGGGGSNNPTNNTTANEPSSVIVVIETQAGSEDFVQMHLAGASLEDAAGGLTDNLVAASRIITVGDPTGEPSGLRLGPAASGSYVALHLVMVPNSGIAIAPNGNSQPVANPIDVRIPITGGLQHTALAASWLVIGHDTIPLAGPPSARSWNPTMTARLDGSNLRLSELVFPVVNAGLLAATATTVDNASVELACSSSCIYEDATGTVYASQAEFFANLSIDDDLVADGDLRRSGRIEATRLRRSSRSDQPRLIGSVLSIDPSTNSFEMLVVATRQNGNQTTLATPETAVIRAQGARVEASSGTLTTFTSLTVGQFVKVKWLSQSANNGVTEYVAQEVEISSSNNISIQPEWEARVLSVDPANQVIVIAPRNNDPIVIQGASVAQAAVLITSTTLIERRQNQGGGSTIITLAEVQPGTDRIWIRGTAIGATTIEATRVRVRED